MELKEAISILFAVDILYLETINVGVYSQFRFNGALWFTTAVRPALILAALVIPFQCNVKHFLEARDCLIRYLCDSSVKGSRHFQQDMTRESKSLTVVDHHSSTKQS